MGDCMRARHRLPAVFGSVVFFVSLILLGLVRADTPVDRTVRRRLTAGSAGPRPAATVSPRRFSRPARRVPPGPLEQPSRASRELWEKAGQMSAKDVATVRVLGRYSQGVSRAATVEIARRLAGVDVLAGVP
jgi:hypothetical protein